MDDAIQTFCSFTGADPAQARHYLSLTDDNAEQAVELYFNSAELSGQPPAGSTSGSAIPVDDDDDDGAQEDDEAMARRLQNEMYGGGSGGADGGVRAPIARTTETLVGGDWDEDSVPRSNMAFRGRPSIFNQDTNIWSGSNAQEVLSRATGGASDTSAKTNHLAMLFRPPVDLIAPINFTEARELGKESQKWILLNLQDQNIFDCQTLNRDLWKNESVRETIREHFIFLQYTKDDPRATEYINWYFANERDLPESYPHIAIIDPRTGERVKTWTGRPVPKPLEFLNDLHEFLDRYSLSIDKKNPVQLVRQPKRPSKDIDSMTEDEMMQMAMNESLNQSSPTEHDDPDALTRAPSTQPQETSKGKQREESTSFDLISSSNTHTEPVATEPNTTRIQFRFSGGRVIRRFRLSDPVRRLFEWLKNAPPEQARAEGKTQFELNCLGKNLAEELDITIQEAGLANSTVMVHYD
ncbi:hypothetical protein K470DRAFT_210527 [Piedraia hortae CBS 480.64]|uniref:UBX domain-containing protein n=1 Tax=Piedraia hortae CBS 480.64 TaxID=1314780 RepID=A0A6A7C7S9_9PEZI|nr:hypothetical protein K470DRAFT_210527 [Piedraia hortae CBS 480.64]